VSDKTLEWEMIHEWGFLDPNMADTATEYVRSKIAEAVAAEREAIIAICMEAGDTALANKCGEIAGAIYVTVARIRARAGGEEVPNEASMSDNVICET